MTFKRGLFPVTDWKKASLTGQTWIVQLAKKEN